MKENYQRRSLLEIHLPDPNPIFEKGLLLIDETTKLKFTMQLHFYKYPFRPFNSDLQSDEFEIFEENDHLPARSLLSYFEDTEMHHLYQKFWNNQWTGIPLNGQRYASSLFYDTKKLLQMSLKAPFLSQNDLFEALIKSLPNQRIRIQTIQQKQDVKGYRGLKFNSNFESGNLLAAFLISEREYDLILQNDTNSKGNTQWFHFSVENAIQGEVVKFNIVNFQKNDSLFNYGQKPVSYSMRQAEKQINYQWQKCGKNVQYYSNKIYKENSQTKTYYTLSFTHKFELSSDVVFFAQCYPYTFKDLIKKIQKYELDPKVKNLMQVKELCRTIGQLSVPYIIIKSKVNKPNILIMARQHPGETPGSHMMDGAMDFILGRSFEADQLRSTFNIYIVPMVNPDGVVHGNYRCNLNGVDLNRIWNCPHRELHDSVYHIRELIRLLNKNGGVSLILDMHGHSKKFNSFFYGNPTHHQVLTRLLPIVSAQINPSISISDCSFTISENKRNTARVALQSDIIGQCYTFETSFHGHQTIGQTGTIAYTQETYRLLGRDVLLAYFQTTRQFSFTVNPEYIAAYPSILTKEKTKAIEDNIKQISQKEDIIIDEKIDDSSGSESNPDADNLIEDETISIQLIQKCTDDLSCITKDRSSSYRFNKQKQSRTSKQTQTDSLIFQSLMLDPNILKNVLLQLIDQRDTDELKKSLRYMSSSDQEYRQDISSNLNTPIQIKGTQFIGKVRRATLSSLQADKFCKAIHYQQQPSTAQSCNVQCQTMVSLQLIVGNYQIVMIKPQQNLFQKKSLSSRNHLNGRNIVKPQNITNFKTEKTSRNIVQQPLIHITSISCNRESQRFYPKHKSNHSNHLSDGQVESKIIINPKTSLHNNYLLDKVYQNIKENIQTQSELHKKEINNKTKKQDNQGSNKNSQSQSVLISFNFKQRNQGFYDEDLESPPSFLQVTEMKESHQISEFRRVNVNQHIRIGRQLKHHSKSSSKR